MEKLKEFIAEKGNQLETKFNQFEEKFNYYQYQIKNKRLVKKITRLHYIKWIVSDNFRLLYYLFKFLATKEETIKGLYLSKAFSISRKINNYKFYLKNFKKIVTDISKIQFWRQSHYTFCLICNFQFYSFAYIKVFLFDQFLRRYFLQRLFRMFFRKFIFQRVW